MLKKSNTSVLNKKLKKYFFNIFIIILNIFSLMVDLELNSDDIFDENGWENVIDRSKYQKLNNKNKVIYLEQKIQ